MHLVMLVEKRPDIEDDFANYLLSLRCPMKDGRQGSGIARQIKIFDYSFYEETLDDVLSQLAPFISREEFVNTNRFLKLMLKFYPKMELIPIEKFDSLPKRKETYQDGHKIARILLIGKYKDDYYDGGEAA